MKAPVYLHFCLYAALSGFIAVALGAFGAHALEGILLPERLAAWQTAVQYQMFHVVALFAAAFLCFQFPAERSFVRSGYGFLAGILLFSGSLYLLCLSDILLFALITPLGGLTLLLAWLLLGLGLFRQVRRYRDEQP